MAEAAQKKVHDGVNNFMEQLDKSHLRRTQGDMHRCAAKCCDDPAASMDDVQRCMDRCSGSLKKIQIYVESEMNSFQANVFRSLSP
jgi:Eukaryotic protein of unknown function (DUF842)